MSPIWLFSHLLVAGGRLGDENSLCRENGENKVISLWSLKFNVNLNHSRVLKKAKSGI